MRERCERCSESEEKQKVRKRPNDCWEVVCGFECVFVCVRANIHIEHTTVHKKFDLHQVGG